VEIEVREATTDAEREAIYQLRYQIYVEELGCAPEFADKERQALSEPIDSWAHNFYALLDGEIVGAVRRNLRRDGPLEHEKLYDFDRFKPYYPEQVSMSTKLVISPRKRGSLVLKQLCLKNYEFGQQQGIKFDFLDCWPHLINLYEHLGYRRYKTSVNHPEAGYMTPMVLVEDLDHLEKVGSPFVEAARRLTTAHDAADFFRKNFPDYAEVGAQRLLSGEQLWSLLSEKLSGSPESDVPLFRGMSKDEIQSLISMGNMLNGRAGDRIIGMNESREEIYTLLSGKAEVRIEIDGKTRSLRTLGKGETFGEVAFLAQTSRSADVVAVEDCDVLVHDTARLGMLERRSPELAMKLYRNLAQIVSLRLIASNRRPALT
jgi:hypothetical protein